METCIAYLPEVVGKFCLAVALSGILGLERQRKGRAAGLRTHILVCLGSTLVMVVWDLMGLYSKDVGAALWVEKGRIAAGVITGVGFLGAGTIITVGGEHRGLTTAAMIWFVAMLGLAIGNGFYLVALCATFFALMTVLALGYLEQFLPSHQQITLRVRAAKGLERLDEIEDVIRKHGFQVETSRVRAVAGGQQVDITFELVGSAKAGIERLAPLIHNQFAAAEKVTLER